MSDTFCNSVFLSSAKFTTAAKQSRLASCAAKERLPVPKPSSTLISRIIDGAVSTPNAFNRSWVVEFKVKDRIPSNSEGSDKYFSMILKGILREANSIPKKVPTMPPPEINTDCFMRVLSH